MAIGVGTYSDGFGVAFTLLDQFSAVAKKIEASMAHLAGATGAFAAKTGGVLDAAFGGGFGISKSGHLMNAPSVAGNAANTIMAKAAAEREASRIAMASGMAEIAMIEQIEVAELAEATVAARLMNNKMANQRIYNGLQRQQLILNREMEAQMEALAVAEAARNAQRSFGLTMLGASLVGLALIVKGAEVDTYLQKEEMAIEGFVGSAERAHAAFLELQSDANNNPMMGLKNMLKTHALLLSQGVPIEESLRLTQNLSNLLTSVGRGAPELNRVGRELEKIAANSKITGRELYQAAAAGIPLRNILEDYFGHTLPNTLKELPITISDLDKAFAKAMQAGGKFAKAFNKMSESILFSWMNMQNQITYFFRYVGQAIEPITSMLVSGLTLFFTVLQLFSQSWIGQAFWIIAASMLVLAGVIGLNIVGGKAWTWVLARLTHGLGHATIASLKATMANEGLAASFAVLGNAVMANPAFVWFTVVAGAIMIATNAIKHFKRVMSGQDEAASGGWVSTLQKLGGVLMFVAEAFSTYDSATRKSKFSQEFVTAIDKLGLHDITSKIQTWVGSIMSFMDGLSDGFYSFFHTLYMIFDTVTAPIRWVLKLLGLITPELDTANGAMEGWANTGKMLAWVLGTLLVGQLFKMGASFVSVIGRMIAAEGELYAFTAPLLLELWPAMVLIGGAAALIATNIDIVGTSFSTTSKKIDDATMAMDRFNAAKERQAKSTEYATRANYDFRNQNYGSGLMNAIKMWWYNDDNGGANDKAVSSPAMLNLPQVQTQQAQIDTTRTNNGYPGLSSIDRGSEKRDVNVTLMLDGKPLATILAPYMDEITRRKNITSNDA